MNLQKEKKIFRSKVKKLKAQISESEKKAKSNVICKKIEELPVFHNSKIVLLFWSMDDEVYTHDFIIKWSKEKKILLPVVLNDKLEIREFTDERSMQRSIIFNINEPAGSPYASLDKIDLVIVPGLAFDKKNRLGHGKGYYDRLLPGIKAYKIGICFDFQLFDKIPNDKYDVKMDLVITN